MSVPAWKQRIIDQEKEKEAAKQAQEEARQRKLSEMGLATTNGTSSTSNAVQRTHQFCTKCGHKESIQSRFCTECGEKLSPHTDSPVQITESSTPAAVSVVSQSNALNTTSKRTVQPDVKPVVVTHTAATALSASSPQQDAIVSNPSVVNSSTRAKPLTQSPAADVVAPAPFLKGRSMPVQPAPRRAQPAVPSPAVKSVASTPAMSTPTQPTQPTQPTVASSTVQIDSEAQRRAKKQIVQLRKLGDAKITKKRVFPTGFIELEAVSPRGVVTAGDTISMAIIVQNKSSRHIAGVRVRLEQQTFVAATGGRHTLHESITWRTFRDRTEIAPHASTEVVLPCTIPKNTPPSGSRQAAESMIETKQAWFVYKLSVSTDAAWVANPTVLFDVELRGHPSVTQIVGPGGPVPGAAAPSAAVPVSERDASPRGAELPSGRSKLSHSRREASKGTQIGMHCVGCGDRSLARICARCFVAGRAAVFCAECGQVFADDKGNALDCVKCGAARGVLPATGGDKEPASVRRLASSEKFSNRAVSPTAVPIVPTSAVPSVAEAPILSPRSASLVVSAPTDVQRNPDAVHAMLAAAGVDPSLVLQNKANNAAPPPLQHSISKPTGFQRNPDAVKALLVAAGVDASMIHPPAAAPAPVARPAVAKQLPQLPPAARATAGADAGATPSKRPARCMICEERPVAARIARHGKELYLCRECTLEQREKFKARGTLNIGASPVRKGPRLPHGPRPGVSALPNNQYVDLELIPVQPNVAPSAAQLERERVDREQRAAEMERYLAEKQRELDAGNGESTEVDVSTVEVIGKCSALFDFVAEHESELTMREGETIQITCRVDDEWSEGFIEDGNGVRGGLFPTAYVKEY